MILSADGNCLESVTNADLVDGMFTIPEGCNIGGAAFWDCTGLTAVTIPEGCNIGNLAFSHCTGLTAVTIPEGCNIGENAFRDCTGLTTVSIPEGCNIGRGAFSGCTGLTAITIPEECNIGQHAFSGCSGLTIVTISEGCNIGNSAFSRCTSLITVTIPEGCDIGQHAFLSCSGLAIVSIPEGCNIGDATFIRCTSLTTVSIAEGCNIGNRAFEDCTQLTLIVVNSENGLEIERIKSLLPENLWDKVIKKAFLDRVQLVQDVAYKRIITDPMTSGLYGAEQRLGLVEDVLSIITRYDEEMFGNFKRAIGGVALPNNEEELVRYKKDLDGLVPSIRKQVKRFQETRRQTSDCIEKLENHCTFLQNLMTTQEKSHSGFFKLNPELHKSLNNELACVNKLINYLKGDIAVTFSNEDLLPLKNKSFVKITLFRLLNKRLEDLPRQEGPRGNAPV